ncbi:NADH-quinone oxidoreductase subunit J [Limibacter armeniacum]|uniref:NADH-quinone oxidoreductase subunit J family protein n=1 Tax=Limibacter armeniacum TaxID=466084 RepID=UPI002FE647E2
MEQYIFYFFAAVTVLPAILILFTRNVLYCALMLLLSFLGVAALYALSGADFLSITQIVVYMGGILVLLLFGVMFTKTRENKGLYSGSSNFFGGIIASLTAFALLSYTIVQTVWQDVPWIADAANAGEIHNGSSIRIIGVNLMTDFILAFELIAVLLLVVLIGAAYVAGKDSKS